ncbi:hypothetical protein MYU51_009415 [Penicillium brevicompactum]|uniref:uncharacterized protein n=1 Tax=Penicillium brevicompactum TaxID=5074 RepID=UPI00254051E0|nr:uncharacterized protein N7506_010738 [Penicillium brevicompactum]KAJ5327636.1 hypothetical protein N7506_010738 [Penicillium brevicompactum]
MSTVTPEGIPDLTGTWVFNRKLSDDPDEVFALQGVHWVIRKALRHARLSLELCQTTVTVEGVSKDDDHNGVRTAPESLKAVTTLQVKQIVNPGGFDSQGSYTVDGSTQDLSVPVFGDIRTQLSFIEIGEIEEQSIRRGFEISGYKGKVIQELASDNSKAAARSNTKEWEAEVIWAFEIIEGKEHLTRNVSMAGNEKKIIARMVYDRQD